MLLGIQEYPNSQYDFRCTICRQTQNMTSNPQCDIRCTIYDVKSTTWRQIHNMTSNPDLIHNWSQIYHSQEIDVDTISKNYLPSYEKHNLRDEWSLHWRSVLDPFLFPSFLPSDAQFHRCTHIRMLIPVGIAILED